MCIAIQAAIVRRSSSSPLISSSTNLLHEQATKKISTTIPSGREDAYVKRSSGVKCILMQRWRSAAVRGGQGRRLRKQMGCKVGSDGTRCLRRERRRRGSKDRDEGKREAIVSGAHTGVGLDSFIGCAAPHGARGREEGSGTCEGRQRRT